MDRRIGAPAVTPPAGAPRPGPPARGVPARRHPRPPPPVETWTAGRFQRAARSPGRAGPGSPAALEVKPGRRPADLARAMCGFYSC